MSENSNKNLIDGVVIRKLIVHEDHRGSLYEVYQASWIAIDPFLQWNIVTSEPGSLRGVHVHPRHADYLHVISGRMLLGLHDLRPNDPADRRSMMIELKGDRPQAVFIPAGVCHGFFFPVRTTYAYGLSTCWNESEEAGCRYDAPSLKLEWPVTNPLLSARDAAPGTNYDEMRLVWLSAVQKAGTI